MTTFWNDIKYGLRTLARNPGFTVVAVLTLAIGIGANIAMFSVVNAVLLRPLPFGNPDRLIVIQQRDRQHGWTTGLSYPDFLDWKEQNKVFEGFAAYTPAQFEVIDTEGAAKIDGAMVSPEFFSMLGTSACLGRTFAPADGREGGEPAALISHDFWRSRFGQEKGVLGRAFTVQDKTYTIIGVLPAGFHYPDSLGNAKIWTLLDPVGMGEVRTNRSYCWLCAAGRLRPGLTLEQAGSQLNQLHQRLTHRAGTAQSEILTYGLHDRVVREIRATLWILAAIVGFVLLIVCANLANLCLTRASSRDKEMAIRGALGADRWRLLRQCTTESLLLSLAGGVAGLLAAVWTTAVFKVRVHGLVPMSDSIRLDPWVLLFGLAICLGVGVFLGVTPFWLVQRSLRANVLMERRGPSRRHALFSSVITGAQIAMALVLSMGSMLMIRSIVRLSSVNAGFNAENLITFNVGLRKMAETQRLPFSQDLIERLKTLPQVKAASLDSSMPDSQRASSAPVTVEGYASPDGKPVRAVFHNVGADYFKTLQIPLQKGRDISAAEHQRKDQVVVISENLAWRFWPETDPVGREIKFCGTSYRVIGVAADMVQGSLKTEKPNHLFLPFDAMFPDSELRVVVRAQSDPASVIGQARAILRGSDPTLGLYDISTSKARMSESISQERFTTVFLTAFASIAVLLIVIGIYGVVSYAVAQRTHEIGIRMALGARRAGILAMVLRQGLVLSLVGSAVGVAGSIGLTRFLSSYLYGVTATDPVTFIGVPLLITGVSMLACWLPARRAAEVEPMEALRCE